MKIVVLVKEIPDLNVWIEIDPETFRPDPDDVICIANPCDLASLGLALKLVQSLGVGSVTVMLLGPKRAEKTLEKCLLYGASRAIHLLCENVIELESHQIALILAEAIRRMNLEYDLIFSGRDGSGSGFATGQIGSQIGSYLDLRQVSEIMRIEKSPGNDDLVIQCSLDFGDRVTLRCQPPLLLRVHPEAGQVDYPSFAASLDSLNIPVEQVELADLKLSSSEIEKRTDVLSVSTRRPRPRKVFAPQSTVSASERIRQIMGGGLEKKQSEFSQGNPQDLAKHIFNFLVQKKILNPNAPEK